MCQRLCKRWHSRNDKCNYGAYLCMTLLFMKELLCVATMFLYHCNFPNVNIVQRSISTCLTMFPSPSQLRHPNLVCLIGVTLDKLPIYLITEYMAKVSKPNVQEQIYMVLEVLLTNNTKSPESQCTYQPYFESMPYVPLC